MSKKHQRKTLKVLPEQALPIRQLKIVLFAALPFGVLAAILLSWDRLFPTPPEKLIEIAWRHDCDCVHDWMRRLESEGFVVRDFELDDLSTARRRWSVPSGPQGCHPATYMGYFLEGHISAATLRRLASERPPGIGIQQVDPAMPDNEGHSGTARSQIRLVSADGSSEVW